MTTAPARNSDPDSCPDGLSAYHSNDELDALLDAAAARVGLHGRLETIGHTVDGRPIRALHLGAPSRAPEPGRPLVLVTANIHGTEVIASEVALRLLAALTAPELSPSARAVRECADVTLVPAVNLDSRLLAATALKEGRRWTSLSRGNRHGVDLNRNFPVPPGAHDVWHPLAGTKYRLFPWYRGPAALSEPESQAVATLVTQRPPTVALSLHSFGRYFLYPYCFSPAQPPHLDGFLAMGERFVSAQRVHRYRVLQARSWYTIVGDLDDWLYETYRTFAVTIELGALLDGWRTRPLRLVSPVSWMNPRLPRAVGDDVIEACLAASLEGIRQAERRLVAAGPP